MEKLKLKINGLDIEGAKGATILETALENGIQIPTFCYDNRLDIYGACGICVVEAEGKPGLLRSCATEIAEGMVIRTDTPRTRESRKANLELLLSQHRGDCRAPCSLACPAQTDCQGYVGLIANGKYEEALRLVKDKVPLAASIGRVCPHPCEEACRRNLVDEPVSILNLKRFAADVDLAKPEPYLPEKDPPTGKRVAVIGGGPGGLSSAYYLAKMGHSVTVYDAMPKMGGMLRYGIPEYRLPKVVVDKEAALIGKMGVAFKNNVRIGKDDSLENIKKSHDAVVIAIGAWESTPMRVPGTELDGVYGGIEFLRKAFANEPVSMGKNVAIVGGGNTAMDACRTAVRLGAEKVYIIYRRTRAEMPAEDIEIVEAEEEGVEFKYLVNPIEVIGENGKVTKLRLQKMRLGEPDESGRRRPVAVEGDEETLDIDTVIAALGQGIAPAGFDGLDLTRWNTIVADDNLFTTNEKGVFAVGDCINDGASIAIESVGHAKKAAEAVHRYLADAEKFLKEAEISRPAPYRVVRDDLTEDDFTNRKKEPRARAHHMAPGERSDNFFEMQNTLDEASAVGEAGRCLECGCHDYFECKLIAQADAHDVQPDRFRESVLDIEFDDDHPFIVRDPNKCILCGLCARACEELIGAAAIGFTDRGFDTVVKPAFEDALIDTPCVACGQCVSVCPTGALQERITFKKPIPLKTEKTGSICGMCGVGCPVSIESYGSLLVKAAPVTDCGISDGVLCARGRFGINYVQKDGRITGPLVRKDGGLEPASWRDAFNYTAKKMQGLKIRGGKTAVSVGHVYSVEDAGAILNLAKLLGSDVFSFSSRENGLAGVLGFDRSPNALEEVLDCGGVFVFGSSMMRNPVIVSKLRRAARNGTPVTVVCGDDNDGAEFNLPCEVIKIKNTTAFIKQAIKALIDSGCAGMGVGISNEAGGYDELKESLSGITAGESAKAFAWSYKSAGNAMILFALEELSAAAAAELANMAVVSGHIGGRGNGIYMLRQMPGSQALTDYGATAAAGTAGGAGGLMIFGEDPYCGEDPYSGAAPANPGGTSRARPDDLEFLMVQDTHMTETAAKADVVFPLAAWPEVTGTFVNSDGLVIRSVRAVPPPFEYSTSETAQGIAEILEGSAPEGKTEDLYPDAKPGERCQAPLRGAQCSGDPNGKAVLRVVGESPVFEPLAQVNALRNMIDAALPDRK